MRHRHLQCLQLFWTFYIYKTAHATTHATRPTTSNQQNQEIVGRTKQKIKIKVKYFYFPQHTPLICELFRRTLRNSSNLEPWRGLVRRSAGIWSVLKCSKVTSPFSTRSFVKKNRACRCFMFFLPLALTAIVDRLSWYIMRGPVEIFKVERKFLTWSASHKISTWATNSLSQEEREAVEKARKNITDHKKR